MMTAGFENYNGRFAKEYNDLQIRWNNLFNDSKICFFKEILKDLKITKSFGILFCNYEEKERKYHNPTHISECFKELDSVEGLVENYFAIVTGLIGHDSIYNTKSKDNEEKSAYLLSKVLINLNVPWKDIMDARDIVIVTHHKTEPRTIDQKFAVDIDLSILGKHPAEFDKYEKNIREEYHWVPEDQFRKGRSEILSMFLDRDSIYSTDFFKKKYEMQARDNLNSSIRSLS